MSGAEEHRANGLSRGLLIHTGVIGFIQSEPHFPGALFPEVSGVKLKVSNFVFFIEDFKSKYGLDHIGTGMPRIGNFHTWQAMNLFGHLLHFRFAFVADFLQSARSNLGALVSFT